METILIKKKKFVVESIKATHPDHITYVCLYAGIHYFVRVYLSGYEDALEQYKNLKHAGINMSKMDYHDDENKAIAFDYFPEDSVLEALANGDLPENYFAALFSLYRFARFSKVALDWEPQNFMLRGSQMFYLPLKQAPLTKDNALEKEGLRYWFRGKECLELLAKKGHDVSGVTPLEENLVNKNMVLMAVKYW